MIAILKSRPVFYLLFVLIMASFPAYWIYVAKKEPGISSRVPSQYRNNPVNLISYASYLQNDPAWKADRIGAGKETIGGVGCLISSTAMALTNMGYSYTPATLNTALSARNGYTKRSWLIWSKIKEVTDGQVKVNYYTEPSHEIIDNCLQKSHYPVVKFMIKRVIPHWVVVTGRQGKEYKVRDPLISTATPIPLSSRTRRILAVRCLKENWSFSP